MRLDTRSVDRGISVAPQYLITMLFCHTHFNFIVKVQILVGFALKQ